MEEIANSNQREKTRLLHIVNWLLTRKCNLNCSYCRIVSDYSNKPTEYPDMNYFHQNETPTEYILKCLWRIKQHNLDSFNIFYGGEPFLRNDFSQIISFCNKENINYTIVSNNSDAIQPKINQLFNEVDEVKGFTSSVDPDIYDRNDLDDQTRKSLSGIEKLTKLKSIVNDVVAEITVSNQNIQKLYKLVKDLTDRGISSSITFIDLAKSKYYDFSDIDNVESLVYPTGSKVELDKVLNDPNTDVHMKDTLGKELYNILPSNYDCKIEENFHNATIDADGSLRLCLRVRGVETPKLKFTDYISESGELDDKLFENIKSDKNKYCESCNWTCPIMSQLIENNLDSSNSLIHSERRNKL